MSGDFLQHPSLQKWYPYLLLLIFLAMVSIANEKSIANKRNIIAKKKHEYKMALFEVKENNYQLPYVQKKIIREKATKRGFVENQKNMYRIPVKKD